MAPTQVLEKNGDQLIQNTTASEELEDQATTGNVAGEHQGDAALTRRLLRKLDTRFIVP
jgi:hypothetical protein